VAKGTRDETWERRNVTRLQTASVRRRFAGQSLKKLSEYEDFAFEAPILTCEPGHFKKELAGSNQECADSASERARFSSELHDSV